MKQNIGSLSLLLVTLYSGNSLADLPAPLTDRIFKGAGVVDLLKDVSASELTSYLSSGSLYVGVDVNESSRAPESAMSQGVALKDVSLNLETSAGDFTFSNFFTNTSSMLTAAGSDVAEEFYTLFGRTGSAQINGGNLLMDDVFTVGDIAFEGTIQSAYLSIDFVDVIEPGGSNEQFFDFSAGFEDLALIDATNADAIDSLEAGVSDAPYEISFAYTAPAGTPEPWWFLGLVFVGLHFMKIRSATK